MADEELRLVATFQDKIGPGLKGSIDKIRQFTKEGVRGSEEGEKSVKKHAKAFQELRERIKYTADLTREEFLPGLEKTALTAVTAGIGIGTLTTAIGLAAAAARGFGESMAELQRGSRATGLSADDLRKWQNFGEIVGVTADQMKTGLAGFNELVEKMQRRPDVFRQMFANFDMAGMAALRDFMLSLKDLPRDQQLDKVMEFIKTIKDVGQQKQVLKFLGLPPEIADDLQHYRENIDRAKESITTLTQVQISQGAEAQKNWIELGQKFADLSIVIGAKFAPAMSEATEELRLWIEKNQGAWTDEAGKWFNTAIEDAKIFGGWLDTIVKDLDKIIDWEKKLPVLFDLPKAIQEGHDKWERNPDGSIKTIPSVPLPSPGQSPDDQKRREQFEKLNPAGSIKTAPGTGIHIPNWGPWHSGSPTNPIIPAPPPDLDEKRRQFEKLNPGGLIHKSAFMVGGDEGGAGAGVSKGTSDMINIIAQGTRRGVYDGLMDFSQTSAAAGGGGGGLMNASLETGGGGGGWGHSGRGGAVSGGGNDYSGIRARGAGGAPVGKEADLARQAVDYWKSQGLTQDQALSVVGNQRGENVLGSLNTAGGSGQFQWDATRRRQILAGTGIDVRTAGFLDQQRAARWEMENSPDKINRVWNQLKTTGSRNEAVGLLVHNYERSLRQGSDIAIRLGHADRYARIMKDKGLPAIAGSGAPGHGLPHDDIGDWIKNVPRDAFRPKGQGGGATGDNPMFPNHQYLSPYGNKAQEASLLRASRQANAGTSKVIGEASLSIKLAGGLTTDGGAKNKGDLFKEIKISRGSIPYASTEA